MIAGLAAAYALWKGYITVFIVLFLIAYLFDCVDGYMARRYNQETVFGDYYDHISDIVKVLVLLTVFFYKYPLHTLLPVLGVLGFLIFMMCIYFGCSQRHINKEGTGETLDILQKLCNSDDAIHWAKYFSCGACQIGYIIAALYLEFMQKKKRR